MIGRGAAVVSMAMAGLSATARCAILAGLLLSSTPADIQIHKDDCVTCRGS